MGKYLAGTTASGIYEARLGYEEMGKENHVFAPAFKDEDMQGISKNLRPYRFLIALHSLISIKISARSGYQRWYAY